MRVVIVEPQPLKKIASHAMAGINLGSAIGLAGGVDQFHAKWELTGVSTGKSPWPRHAKRQGPASVLQARKERQCEQVGKCQLSVWSARTATHTVTFFILSGESEDQTQNEACNPHLKRVREVHHIEPKPLQTTRATMAVAKSPEKPYYCRENQSNEEALKMMRELDLPYLPVLNRIRVVGVVSMRDLMRSKEQ